jgi:hypothetical protein
MSDRTESELKTAMNKFFHFLDQEKGITNVAVPKSFQRYTLDVRSAASGGLVLLVARGP